MRKTTDQLLLEKARALVDALIEEEQEREHSANRKPPPCYGMTALFFGTELDGRNETGRQEREEKAKDICFSCEYRMPCLEKAMVLKDENGVWGGMTEGERRKFRRHMAAEGYGNMVPEGDEFWATLNSFYRAEEKERKRRAS